jgi:hypothetical protein
MAKEMIAMIYALLEPPPVVELEPGGLEELLLELLELLELPELLELLWHGMTPVLSKQIVTRLLLASSQCVLLLGGSNMNRHCSSWLLLPLQSQKSVSIRNSPGSR